MHACGNKRTVIHADHAINSVPGLTEVDCWQSRQIIHILKCLILYQDCRMLYRKTDKNNIVRLSHAVLTLMSVSFSARSEVNLEVASSSSATLCL